MAKFLSFRIWPAILGLALLLIVTGAVWAVSPEAAVNVDSCTPPTGPIAGGIVVALTGTGFLTGATVTFGGIPATLVSVPDATDISCTTPTHALGPVTINVTNPDLTTSGEVPGLYTYLTTPTVTSVSPPNGPPAGGTSVIITGTSFTGVTGAASVVFGPTNATTFTVNTDTQITATSPAGTGTVDVRVTNGAYGQSPVNTPADQFTYTACSPPTVTSLNVITGTTCGGTHVTITGTNFTGATAVDFGLPNPATSVVVVNSTTITCVSPAHAAGFVDVQVTTPCATSTPGTGDGFTYATAPVPAVTSIAPATGNTAGGTSVTITGTGFTSATPPTAVLFGANPATSVVVAASGTTITCVSPAGTGTVDVKVTTCGGTSPTVAADQFTYVTCSLPGVDTVTPSTGSTAGGTIVTITGKYFTGVNAVTFGTVAATTYTFNSDTQITATSPAGTGTVDVTVRTACGTSAIVAADHFTYGTVPPPTVTAINPTHGPESGGTSVAITGTNFVSGTGLAVYMGSTAYPCTSVASSIATSITAVTPAHVPGKVDVIVRNPDAQMGSGILLYTYDVSSPVVTGVSPNKGPAAGGTTVAITGANFTGATAVTFGGTSATFTLLSASQITATSPAHAAGLVDVRVTTPSGTSAVVVADQFTFVACTLACDTTVPTTGQTNAQIQFSATAAPDPNGCTGTVTYLWTFGDNTTSTEQNPKHTYTTPGVYSWNMTATIGTTTCQKYGSISIITPPYISMIKKKPNPFRLKVMGLNFHSNCTVKVNGVAVPETKWKSSILVIAKKGNALKALIPAGQTVQITITNNDDGGVSTAYPFFR